MALEEEKPMVLPPPDSVQETSLIKSKERVQKHGEVFTPDWMVKKMLSYPERNANPRIDKRTFRTPNLENRLIYGLLKHLASRVHFLFFGEKIICTFFAPHLSKTKMHNI